MIDIAAPDAEDRLEDVIGAQVFRGLRMTAAMLRQAPGIASAAIEAGLHLVLYCPDGTDEIASVLPALASGPGRIVITHLGSPIVSDGRLARGEEILRLVPDPRIMVTLSGAGMACDPPHEPLGPLVRKIVDGFGAERVMWASNYPVVGDQDAARADLDLLLTNYWGLPASAIEPISGVVAERTWFIGGRNE